MFRQGNTVAYQRSQSFLKSLLLGLLLGAGIIFAVPSQASAISNNGPDPAELGGRAGERFGYTVATPGVGGGGTTVPIPIYYQDNAGTKTITITGGDLCNDPIESAPLTGGNDRDVSYDPAANAIGAIATQFYMRNEQQGTNHGEIFSHVTDVDTCFSDQLVLTFNATTALTYDARLNMFYGYLYASMSGAVVDAANRFNVVADSTAKIGFSARNSAETFGVSRLHPYSGENEFRLPFAPDCTLTTGVRRVQAVLYDLDNGDPDVQNSLNMQIYVEETTLENAGVRIPAQFTTTADPASAPVQSTGDPSGYTVTSGNNGTVYVQFDVVAGNKYILGVTNVHYKNGIQFQLPFDSIYADVTACDPPKDLACGTATVNPTDPEINEPLTVAATLRFNRQVTAVLTDPTLSVRLRNGTGAPLGVTVAQLGNTVTLTSDAYVATAPGLHTVQWAITINGERITCGGSFRSSDSFLVLSHPLLKVTGGDVATGSSFSTGSGTGLVPCDRAQHNPKAGIVSWNRGAPTFVGAGTQYAVFAMSYIQNFVTNQGNSQPPTSLSFSNVNYRPEAMNSVDPATGFFGGLFGAGPCVDYWGSKPPVNELLAVGDNPNLSTLASGRYQYRGGPTMTIGANSIPDGRRITIYVEGDVNIAGDIAYMSDGSTWVTAFQIPAFKLIVNGRIFINSTVNRVDGLYAAIPNEGYVGAPNTFIDPIPGTLSTCSNGFTSYDPKDIAANDYPNACNRLLTVNGSFIANQIFFLRTYGTLSTNQPGEVFNYNPEMWLAPPDHDDFDPSYRSVVGLPPVL